MYRYSTMIRFLLIASVLLFSGFSAMAADTATTPHFTAKLVSESRTPAPGKDVTTALLIKPEKGWHTYWANPGATGLAPELDWKLPKGVTAGDVRHPVPTKLVIGGIASNVHSGPVALLTNLSVPETLAKGTPLPVGLDVDLLICSEGQCVPETVSLNLQLTIGDGTPDPAERDLFAKARAALPTPLSQAARYAVDGANLKLFVPVSAPENIASAHIFLRNEGVIPAGGTQQLAKVDHGLTMTLSRGKKAPGKTLSGVVRIVHADQHVTGYRFVAQPGPVPSAGSKLGGGFVLALGGALLGGLLLNLMPCVFPILSLKALALARAGGDDREAQAEAIGYTIGAVSVLLALGGAVLAFKSGGHAVGWAFQLQDTRVVAILLLLVTAIATNLAGLYELPSLNIAVGHRQGLIGGIGTGALAAFIATPCTGPFMAGALGAALLLPVPAALAVFFGLGLGLSLPFLALGFIKPARRWLPKPGPWMMTLRRVLSLPMFATALGLGWIVGRQAGVSAMTIALAAALLLGVSLWWYGLRQLKSRRGLPTFVPAIAAIILAYLGVQASSAATEQASHLLASKPYTAARLAKLRDEHRPVFVFLTADWCLSCKVNEATSLSSTSVANAFAKAHVAVLEGDWTRKNPEVTALLRKRGRAGVPLYVWYPVNGAPKDLPQVLTPSMLVDLTHGLKSSQSTS